MAPKQMKIHARVEQNNLTPNNAASNNKNRLIHGVELLNKDENQIIEDQLFLTEDDVRRIKKL